MWLEETPDDVPAALELPDFVDEDAAAEVAGPVSSCCVSFKLSC